MVTIKLDAEERELLVEVLEGYLSDLRMEIADTDSPFFKDQLRGRKGIINRILDSLRVGAEAS